MSLAESQRSLLDLGKYNDKEPSNTYTVTTLSKTGLEALTVDFDNNYECTDPVITLMKRDKNKLYSATYDSNGSYVEHQELPAH